MNEKRMAHPRRALKSAFIDISERAPKIECSVRNLSEVGAALQVSTTFGIPKHFHVVIDGMRRACRAAWRTDTKLAVRF